MTLIELLLATVLVASCASILYVLFKARMERLTERELIVQQVMESGLYDGQSTNEGYIFRYLWRLSHVVSRGKELGYTLTLPDCYKIVVDIKKNFDPTIGISEFVIDMHIREYVKKRNELKD